jgi:2'-5' RNA ligase
MPTAIRAFIAIALPADIKTRIKNHQAPLKCDTGNSVKWVDPEIIHLTLKFLGDITDDQIIPVTNAMRESVASTHPFILRLQGIGAFPSLNRAQVVWAGINGNLDSLLALQNKLDANLVKLNFPPERRPFSPHLTLGRVRDTAALTERQKLSACLSSFKIESGTQFEVKSIDLVQSRLLPAGPLYTRLQSVEFL